MAAKRGTFRELAHDVDVCVVGGGMAGLCAALAAARLGARVALMHDRPVLGGNASSEMRVHVCGADRGNQIPNLRETGILEELRLESLRRNPHQNASVWDTILYEKIRFEPNLSLMLNCSCMDAEMSGGRIASVTGWQLTTQTVHTVRAAIFADCSGDGVLAPLTGAAFRMGREGRDEYGESLAPEQPDDKTMGMSCLFQAREHDSPQPFEAPAWACVFEKDEDLPFGGGSVKPGTEIGYWWIELGGEHHSIHDTELVRDELLKIVYGVWNHIKNRGDHGAENWALEWVQFLPAKRESRRYLGEHMLTQNDLEAEGRFEDIVAYGGWPMDDHDPAGFWAVKAGRPATTFSPTPSPYGIPYRALYSRNVENLMFAGRCAGCSHMAMSSTRVMGTACSMGQAVGTAAAMAAERRLPPAEMNAHMTELQQALLRDDCYLPGVVQQIPPLTASAELTASQGNPEPVRDGVNRPVGEEAHCWTCRPADDLAYRFIEPALVQQTTLVLDSALDRLVFMSLHCDLGQLTAPPDVMPRRFHLDGLKNGEWRRLADVSDNHQRLVRVPVQERLEGIRFTLDATWGAEQTRVFAFWVT